MSMKKLGLFFILIFYLLFVFCFPNLMKTNIIAACLLFVEVIMPSILPMYLIGSLLTNTNFISQLFYPLLKPILHFENITSCSIYLLSIIIGNPTTTILINKAIDNGSITNNEGKRLIGFTFFMNPLFISNICPPEITFPIIIGSLLSSLIIGFLSKNDYLNNCSTEIKQSVWSTLEKTPTILLNILLMMIVVSIIKTPLTLFNHNNLVIKYLGDLLEISTGLVSVVKYSLHPNLLIILISFLVNSNGMCLVLQTLQVASFIDVKDFLKKRIFSSIISVIVTLVVYFLFYS